MENFQLGGREKAVIRLLRKATTCDFFFLIYLFIYQEIYINLSIVSWHCGGLYLY